MLRVPVLRGEREQAAWAAVCRTLEQLHSLAIDNASEIAEIHVLTLPPQPAPQPKKVLLVEPPADMSALPAGARQALLGAVLGAADGARRGRQLHYDAATLDAIYQAASEVTCACVVGVETDGAPRMVQVRAQAVAGQGVLPLAAIDREERVAVLEAVQRHLATFRDLL